MNQIMYNDLLHSRDHHIRSVHIDKYFEHTKRIRMVNLLVNHKSKCVCSKICIENKKEESNTKRYQ